MFVKFISSHYWSSYGLVKRYESIGLKVIFGFPFWHLKEGLNKYCVDLGVTLRASKNHAVCDNDLYGRCNIAFFALTIICHMWLLQFLTIPYKFQM